ncbi:MAG: Ferric uptake regulator, Fur family [Candidatus Uhrbacteria bacterium GW2011_GWF2_41_16]|uniref:Ferric uptake regulator, Fur family n=2 Tax=Candidatus Uhriibacteriota TaxID=1752732 RepID=A0A0G0VE97_9BACT|nr:MAG: Ferric uptake regulator, Fur family [Candidatus Uhrbacteria bacterium GW2011_GWC2_41_11]KKR98001.1 MAG: Ferric uptake regulator, Fur family [Candidatus Uhrbacteria bacterium GW2011_GWF2_41_16]HBO99634.1 hypothetical protein [Candidatus Uhrbacteria bacterium]
MDHCFIETNLKKIGLRKTVDRHKILERFAEHRTWSASQLFHALPHMDLSTVYRNIEILVQKNMIRPVHSHDDEIHYEQTQDTHHDHLICRQCDIVHCIPCPIRRISEHHLELFGLCETCKHQ